MLLPDVSNFFLDFLKQICKGSILGDLGADSGARKSRNGRKKSGRRKVKGKDKSPWGKCFSRVVPNGQARSGS